MKRAVLIPAIAVTLGGCALQPARTTTDRAALTEPPAWHKTPAPGGGTPGSSALVCLPSDSAYLVRDLTRPWAERVYLLADGATCRPPRRVS